MNTSTPGIMMITARADFGGGQEHVYRLLNVLKDKVNFYAACPEDYPYWEMYRKLLGNDRIIRIPHRKFSPASLIKLGSFCIRNKIKIVHSHGKGAGIYSRLLSLIWGIKCFHTFHGIHIGEYTSLQKQLYILIERFFSLFTHKFICVSISEYNIVKHIKLASDKKIVIIPNGTPIPEKTGKVSLVQDVLDIVTITRFDFAKNSSLLIPIAEELLKKNKKKFRFVIIGTGPEEEKFRVEIIKRGLADSFFYTGTVLNTGDYLVNSFCYISTSRWEGLPLSVLEAMSYGIPVIATNVPGNKDLVEHEINGYLYNIDQPLDAARLIESLASDETIYRTLAAGSRRKIINNYSLNKMADETYSLYSGSIS